MILYIGRLVTQYRKSANARFMIKIVVYLAGGLSNPKILLLWAQGIARRVRRLPKAPTKATIKHLYGKSLTDISLEFTLTHNEPAAILKSCEYGYLSVPLVLFIDNI